MEAQLRQYGRGRLWRPTHPHRGAYPRFSALKSKFVVPDNIESQHSQLCDNNMKKNIDRRMTSTHGET